MFVYPCSDTSHSYSTVMYAVMFVFYHKVCAVFSVYVCHREKPSFHLPVLSQESVLKIQEELCILGIADE